MPRIISTLQIKINYYVGCKMHDLDDGEAKATDNICQTPPDIDKDSKE